NVSRSAFVRRAARRFFEQNFGPDDVAAVVYTSGRRDAAQEFTNDRQLLISASDKFVGQKLRSGTLDSIDSFLMQQASKGLPPPLDENGMPAPTGGSEAVQMPTDQNNTLDYEQGERRLRANKVLNALRDLSAFMGAVHGRRKALLLFSEGVDYPVEDAFAASGVSDVQLSLQEAIAEAARSNVNFYTIDPRGLAGLSQDFIEVSCSPDDERYRLNSEGFFDELRISQ